jgi:hypothetical protein
VQVHRFVARVLLRPPTAAELATFAPPWDGALLAEQSAQRRVDALAAGAAAAGGGPAGAAELSSPFGLVLSSAPPWLLSPAAAAAAEVEAARAATRAARRALAVEVCSAPEITDEAAASLAECGGGSRSERSSSESSSSESSGPSSLAVAVAALRLRMAPVHAVYLAVLGRPADSGAQKFVARRAASGWSLSEARRRLVAQLCASSEYLSGGGRFSFARGFRPSHVTECAALCTTLPGYADGGAARACAASAQ